MPLRVGVLVAGSVTEARLFELEGCMCRKPDNVARPNRVPQAGGCQPFLLHAARDEDFLPCVGTSYVLSY